jgi:hypothetical protein
LDDKLAEIRSLIDKWLKKANIQKPVMDTMEAFNQLFPHLKHDKNRRMKSQYSYDMRDNEIYKNIYKVEEWLHQPTIKFSPSTFSLDNSGGPPSSMPFFQTQKDDGI